MQVVLELEHIADLEILLPLLKRLGVKIVAQDDPSLHADKQEKPPLSKHIGEFPSADVDAFNKYLKETRDEWERPSS